MIGDNIKKLRQSLNMTQVQFAERIALTQGAIASAENNKRGLSKQALLSISREFGVRLEWLETGEGEMYKAPDTSVLAQLESSGVLTPKGRELMEIYLRLPPEAQDLIADAIATAARLYPRKAEQTVKPDGEKTREEAHAILDAEFDAREAAAKRGTQTSSVSIISSGSLKKSGRAP